MRTPDELTRRFRDRGLKVTPQRQAVFRALHDNHTHPSAESVYAEVSEQMPTISLRTVYQTLNDLASMGELHPLDVGTGSTRFDPNLEPHHHVVCDGCGRVRDIRLDLTTMAMPPELFGDFTVTSTEVVLRGTCTACSVATAATATT